MVTFHELSYSLTVNFVNFPFEVFKWINEHESVLYSFFFNSPVVNHWFQCRSSPFSLVPILLSSPTVFSLVHLHAVLQGVSVFLQMSFVDLLSCFFLLSVSSQIPSCPRLSLSILSFSLITSSISLLSLWYCSSEISFSLSHLFLSSSSLLFLFVLILFCFLYHHLHCLSSSSFLTSSSFSLFISSTLSIRIFMLFSFSSCLDWRSSFSVSISLSLVSVCD